MMLGLILAGCGGGSGGASSEVVSGVAAAPARPTALNAVGGNGQVTLSWASVSDATSYNIYYSSVSGVTTSNGTKVSAATNNHLQAGLATGSTYYFIVTAVNSVGESAASGQASATTASTPQASAVPAAPAAVTATGGTKQVTLSWGAVNSATSYNVYYATTSGVTTLNGTKLANVSSPAVLGGLADGTSYYYIVTAVNSAGEGPASIQTSAATTAATPPPAPACGSCHAIPPALGEHAFHAAKGIDCATCHGAGYSSTTTNAATHMNGVKNVSLSVWNPATRSCASYCHGTKAW